MKLLVILIFASGLTGCASFYSNVNHDELSQYEASVWREGNTISMEIKNVAGLNIYELDHRVVGDAVILSAHRISSGGSAKRTFQIEIPEAVRAVFWLNRDGSRLRVTMSPRPPKSALEWMPDFRFCLYLNALGPAPLSACVSLQLRIWA